MASYYSKSETEAVKLLKIQLDIVNSQNTRLNEENSLLRHKLNRLTNEQRTTSNTSVESALKLHAVEEERDKMYESLERLKGQYNRLHSAYLEKVKRCKSLEEVFVRQKMLPGLVKKSTFEDLRGKVLINDNTAEQQQQQQQQQKQEKIATLQRSLDEAFDIIDELEFELESVDFLELENERLKNELSKLKKNPHSYDEHRTKSDDHQHRHDQSGRSSTSSSTCDECGCNGLPDAESLERSVLTESLIDAVQTESHLLRRELLRSRLQNTRPHHASGCLKGVTKKEEDTLFE